VWTVASWWFALVCGGGLCGGPGAGALVVVKEGGVNAAEVARRIVVDVCADRDIQLARAEARRWREGLLRYGAHDQKCGRDDRDEVVCVCGLDGLIREAKA
jgi:hypothetical protein